MAAVLAQMRGDAIGAGCDRGKRGAHRIGITARPRVAQRGDVIDIDAKAQRWRFGHGGLAQELESGWKHSDGQARAKARNASSHSMTRASIFSKRWIAGSSPAMTNCVTH